MLNLAFSRQVLLALTLGLFSLTTTAHSLNHQEALQLSTAGKILPAQEILNLALANKPQAQLLEMRLRFYQDQHYYKIKLVSPNQEIHRLIFQAATGELIKEASYTNAQRQHRNKNHQHRRNFDQRQHQPKPNATKN